jgi:hypothetical protein
VGRDALAGLVCCVGSLVLLAMTWGLPQPALVPVGPDFYPRILLTTSAVLGAALTLAGLRGGRAAPRPPVSHRLVVVTFAGFAGYVALLQPLGYRVATFLFVGGLAAALEPPRGRRWIVVLVVALATTLVTYYVFEGYLSVLLPRGRLTGL